MAHAKLSPSGANKWTACAASAGVEQDSEDLLTIYAAEGTAAHFLASEILDTGGYQPNDYIGRAVYIDAEGTATWKPLEEFSYKFAVTQAMADNVMRYVRGLHELAGKDSAVWVEQALDISGITGEEGAEGTADAVAIRGTELQIHDLKYGMKRVEVEGNKQLLIYAAAALQEYGIFAEIDQVLIAIHQPRVVGAECSSQVLTLDELEEYMTPIRAAAAIALEVLGNIRGRRDFDPYPNYATPGPHCSDNYCKVRVSCPALLGFVEKATEEANKFLTDTNTGTLGALAIKIPVVRGWCKAVEDILDHELLENGADVPGFKVVLGREGNRAWLSEESVAELAKELKVPRRVTHEEILLSPTKLDKQYKDGKISKGKWPRFEELITRSEAKPVVAFANDKRPAIQIKKEDLTDGFDSI